MKRAANNLWKRCGLAAAMLAVFAVACNDRAVSQGVQADLPNLAYPVVHEAPGKGILTAEEEKFLDDLQRRGIQYFIDEADP